MLCTIGINQKLFQSGRMISVLKTDGAAAFRHKTKDIGSVSPLSSLRMVVSFADRRTRDANDGAVEWDKPSMQVAAPWNRQNGQCCGNPREATSHK
jgi:hypothetical protein